MLASENTANVVAAILHWREVVGARRESHPDDESAALDLEMDAVDMQQEFRAFKHTVEPRTSGFQRFMEVQTGDVLLDYLADLDLNGEYGKVREIGAGNAAFVVTAKTDESGTLAIEEGDPAGVASEDEDHTVTFLAGATAQDVVDLINADLSLPFTAALATGSDGTGAAAAWARRVIGAVPKRDARIEIAGEFFVQKTASKELLEIWDVQNESGGLLKTLLLAPAK
jgi:hypothetical protein